MIFVKVIIGILLYLSIGIGVLTLISRLDDTYDEFRYDMVVIFGGSTIWPLFLLFYLFKIFIEKVSKFWNDFLDRIETIKEERDMEEEDE